MVRLKSMVEELDEIAHNLDYLQGHFYEDKHFFNENHLTTLRDILQVLHERFSSAYIHQALELIDYDSIIEKLVSLKEVDFNDYEQNGILDPEQMDIGSFVSDKTEECYSNLYFEAQPQLNELLYCINKILLV